MVRYVQDDFTTGKALSSCWKPWTTGGGVVRMQPEGLQLLLPPASGDVYADAQITDYAGLPRRAFPWRPPLRMTVRAYASGSAESLRGTAGFGFWNDPFMPGRRELPRLPRAVWFFFGGPASNMSLALAQPGHGWKAATFDPLRPLFFALLPFAPIGFPLMRIPALYRALWPVAQRALGVAEAVLPGGLLAAPHDYSIEWAVDSVTFKVDNRPVLVTDRSPGGPLGFIAWIDNQYAVITPQGRFGWGVVPCAAQWLLLQRLAVAALA